MISIRAIRRSPWPTTRRESCFWSDADHESGEAQAFYRNLPQTGRVGIEATGPTQWFERQLRPEVSSFRVDWLHGRNGAILDATNVGDNVTITLNVPQAGTYDAKVAVGCFSVAASCSFP